MKDPSNVSSFPVLSSTRRRHKNAAGHNMHVPRRAPTFSNVPRHVPRRLTNFKIPNASRNPTRQLWITPCAFMDWCRFAEGLVECLLSHFWLPSSCPRIALPWPSLESQRPFRALSFHFIASCLASTCSSRRVQGALDIQLSLLPCLFMYANVCLPCACTL